MSEAIPACAAQPGSRPAPGVRARLLQLASPALPIGAYSYSSGLESAIDAAIVVDETTAFDWIRDMLELVLGRFDAPLIARAMACGVVDDATDARGALDAFALAARETAELRLEATQMAYSLSQWIAQIVPAGDGDDAPFSARSVQLAWAVAAQRMGIEVADAVAAWLWGFAENQVMVLIKALPIGQIAGQRLLFRLGPIVDQCAQQACTIGRDGWTNASPGLAIASMRHERQYSRLFRS